jgi:GTP-binding protein Era
LHGPLWIGYLAIVGRPNAGKSTLLNALLGQKLSIVTFKAQTTRHRVVGILSNSTSQVILVDTPGFILQMRNKLEEVMMQTVRRSLKDSDAVLVLIDLTIDHKEQLAMLAPPPNAPPTAIVLNKIDTVPVRSDELCCFACSGQEKGR